MRLMLRDVEPPDTEREVHRIEIFERGGEIREVERGKQERKEGKARGDAKAMSAAFAFSALLDFDHAGRRSSPSFRLPVR